MQTIDLPSGTVHYRVAGPEESAAPPVVFVHAFLVNGAVWSKVADLLAERGIRSYAPDWPLGAHRTPLRPDADRSPRGVARQIASFLEALNLDDVTLVGNDTGGALVQFLLDTDPGRVGRVVLTNCDAFDSFPPFPFNVILRLLKGSRLMKFNLLPMRSRVLRHSPLGFGLLANELDAELTRSWIEPALTQQGIRDDAVRFLRAADPRDLLDVSHPAEGLPGARPHRVGHCRPRVQAQPRPTTSQCLPRRGIHRGTGRPHLRPTRCTTETHRPDRRLLHRAPVEPTPASAFGEGGGCGEGAWVVEGEVGC